MAEVKKIAHLAIVVDDFEKTLAFWRDALGMAVSPPQDVPAEGAQIAFMPVGESHLELVKPLTTNSGLARFLEKRGPGLHHICLQVDDIGAMLAQLKASEIDLINETPVEGSDGRKYAFVHPKAANGVLVELYELPGA